MRLKDIKELLSANVLCGDALLDKEVDYFYASDLMSDILATVKEPGVLITAMVQPQVIRTVQMLDLIGVVFVNGKYPPEDTLKLAKSIELPVLVTRYSMFETCGKIYISLMR